MLVTLLFFERSAAIPGGQAALMAANDFLIRHHIEPQEILHFTTAFALVPIFQGQLLGDTRLWYVFNFSPERYHAIFQEEQAHAAESPPPVTEGDDSPLTSASILAEVERILHELPPPD